MNALLRWNDKWNIALAGPGRLKARDRYRYDGCDLSGAITWRHMFVWCMFDGHFGIHEVVQTVTNNMTQFPR